MRQESLAQLWGEYTRLHTRGTEGWSVSGFVEWLALSPCNSYDFREVEQFLAQEKRRLTEALSIHPLERGLFEAWLTATQGEEETSKPERYYLAYNPTRHCWELWEHFPALPQPSTDIILARFYDGTEEKKSFLADIYLRILNVIAEMGKLEEGEQGDD